MPPEENKPINQDQFSQIVDRLKEANNVLVTVRNDPSIDQLAACIGLTLALNKKGKHATAVFSGEVPSIIEFLEPDKTLEKNTDSLRDFIISLDKSKADKLRYKVEDSVVKIFITPYKTSITDQDLDFSQGDFNVDAVVAIGVHERTELDAAIVAHGRILHDATVIAINTEQGPELGSINWTDTGSSSLSEMTSDLVSAIDKLVIDAQIATAFLTGVVAETDRFRNEKASPHTMSVSGVLMAAGASTQLVASKLEEVPEPSSEIPEVVDELDEEPHEDDAPAHDGMIEINHEPDDDIHIDEAGKLQQVAELLKAQEELAAQVAESVEVTPEEPAIEEVQSEPIVDEVSEPSVETPQADAPQSNMILEPPTLGGQLTANSVPEHQQYEGSTDPLSTGANSSGPTLSHQNEPTEPEPIFEPVQEAIPAVLVEPEVSIVTPEPAPEPISNVDQTLSDLEKSLNSPHALDGVVADDPLAQIQASEPVPPPPEPDYARDAVERAVQASNDYRPEPLQSLGASNLGINIGGAEIYDPEESTDQGPPPPPVPPPFPPAGV